MPYDVYIFAVRRFVCTLDKASRSRWRVRSSGDGLCHSDRFWIRVHSPRILFVLFKNEQTIPKSVRWIVLNTIPFGGSVYNVNYTGTLPEVDAEALTSWSPSVFDFPSLLAKITFELDLKTLSEDASETVLESCLINSASFICYGGSLSDFSNWTRLHKNISVLSLHF